MKRTRRLLHLSQNVWVRLMTTFEWESWDTDKNIELKGLLKTAYNSCLRKRLTLVKPHYFFTIIFFFSKYRKSSSNKYYVLYVFFIYHFSTSYTQMLTLNLLSWNIWYQPLYLLCLPCDAVPLILTSCLLFPTTTLFKHIISQINTRRLISTTRYSNFSNKFPHHLFGKRQTTYIHSTFPFNSKNPEENQSINVLFISYFCFNLQAAESRYPGASFL